MREKEMEDYRVNPQDLNAVFGELVSSNEKLQTKIDELEKLRTDLQGMWEGGAEETYTAVMAKDLETLKTYHALMQQYCSALSEISREYADTEMQNIKVVES